MESTRSRYPFSDDYVRLRELLDRGYEVICLAEYKVDGYCCYDICKGAFRESGNEEFSRYVFSARGIEYCSWNSRQSMRYGDYPSFEDMMALHKIKFLDINEK